ncbi:MAG: flippase-like domain-containing protein [Bacteroides sp.]|nr:flippase-like domain-containing protein [Bacteroides sp.]
MREDKAQTPAKASGEGAGRKDMIKDIVKVVASLGVTAGMLVWLFHKVNFHQVMTIIRDGVDYRYLFIMMFLTMLSHVIRGIRWGIQLRAAGVPRMPVVAESVSIFGAYALNLLFPFLGEAWRCVYVSKRENVKLSTVIGTDLGDRASDGVMIVLVLLLTLVVARGAMDSFLDKYPLGESIEHVFSHGLLFIVIAAVIVGVLLIDHFFGGSLVVKKFNASVARMWQGFVVLFHMKGIDWYLVLTIGIWTCYFFQTYSCFYAFPFTRELISEPGLAAGFIPGLVVFVFGSCSMGIPSNGGLGPWNVAVMFALSLYGISDTDGTAYSIVCWSFQTVMLIACGIFSAFYILSSRRRRGAA